MKTYILLAALLGLGFTTGCGGPEPVDTSKSVAPRTPEEMKADIEKAMKEKGMSESDYGKQ